MTPLNPQQPQSRGGFAAGLLIGLSISGVLLLLGGVSGMFYVQKKARDARAGWNLVPVVVAAVDVAEGEVITFEKLSQRSIPEQFVTSSIVKPDSASYVVNQKVLVPLQAGDPLLWSQFDAKKKPVVLFAAHDVAKGVKLAEADCEERAVVGEDVLTASWVRTEDRPRAVGSTVLAPFRRGDPILWTHLDGGR